MDTQAQGLSRCIFPIRDLLSRFHRQGFAFRSLRQGRTDQVPAKLKFAFYKKLLEARVAEISILSGSNRAAPLLSGLGHESTPE